jgi:nickel transport protein
MKRWPLLLLCWLVTAQAHEIHHRVEAAQALVVSLSYANGEPFAYEKYALYPAGQETPVQVGNTDAAGRVAFVPGATRKWRLQASSADGHGVNLEFAAPDTSGAAATTAATAPARWQLAAFGLALLFGVFGLVQLFVRHGKKNREIA